MPRKLVFRAQAFPVDAQIEDLKSALGFGLNEDDRIQDILILPSCPPSSEKRTVLFSVLPPVLGPLGKLVSPEPEKCIIVNVRGKDVSLDTNFHGFTQMNQPQGKPILAE